MKLSIDISELIQLGKKMLPEGVDFFWMNPLLTLIQQILSYPRVKKLVSKILTLVAGLSLIMAARFFYILGTIQGVMMRLSSMAKKENVFILPGAALDEMRHKNRFERYHATNRIDGLFEIDDGSGRSQDVDLRVCMNCLERLNYKGSIDKQRKRDF